jgi:hypothetical protein
MRQLAEVIHHSLRWTQPRLFERSYELQSGTDVVATLSFGSAFGSLATARSADGAWTFKRVGFWRAMATVRAEGEPGNLAVFEHNTWQRGGTLRLAGGRSILVTTNLWQSKIEFRMSDDEVLFRYNTEGFLRQEAELDVSPTLEGWAETPWLLPFGWYLVVMMHQDSSSAVIVP